MIQSVKRSFEILKYIASNGNLVRLNDIANAVGLQSTTVHNFLNTLKDLGYVEQDELTPRYRVTAKINELYLPEKPLHQIRLEMKPLLEQVSMETGGTTHLATQIGSYFRWELKQEPKRTARISLEVGKEGEMRHTAIGKVFMAYSPHLFALMGQEMSEPEAAALRLELAQVLADGYALDEEEYQKDLNCIAVPYLCRGKVLAVVGVSAPATTFNKEVMLRTGERIKTLLPC